MAMAIQQADDLQAKNPPDDDVLIDWAKSLGLNGSAFAELLNSPAIRQQLLAEIKFARSMGVNSFPSLVLEQAGDYKVLNYDYNDPRVFLSQVS